MSGTFANLLYHVVFSTKNRLGLITEPIQADLYSYIGGIVRGEGGILLEIGGVPDHVHLLLKLKPSLSVSDALMRIKAKSSKWLNSEKLNLKKFAWQDGYGAFTVSESQVESVRSYIRNQVEHHRRQTYQEEFVAMLTRHGIEFDERYIWR